MVWPRTGRANDVRLSSDLQAIEGMVINGSPNVYLEEARRLRDIETARKDTADTKSQIYLTALLAIIPILVSLTEKEGTLSSMNMSEWYGIVASIFFVLGIIYGMGAFVSSFRALSVRAYNRIDIADFIAGSLSGATSAEIYFTKEILKSIRLDREIINFKISYVIVTHQLLFRMAIFIISALFMITIVPDIVGLYRPLKASFCGM